MEIGATAEWDSLQSVMVHGPGPEMFYGLLEPNSFLYDRVFDQNRAIKEHQGLVDVLEVDYGVRVLDLRSILLENEDSLHELAEQAAQTVRFTGPEDWQSQAKKYLDENIDSYSPEHFLNIVLFRPTVQLRELKGDTVPFVTLRAPLCNLFFVRDQQILLDEGFVIGRPRYELRRGEETLTRLAFNALGADVLHEIETPGFLEGGDFIPAGETAFIGKGDRTNENALRQLRSMDPGFDEIVVVKNPDHPALGDTHPMVTMHLDTYFNILGEKLAVAHPRLLGRAKLEIWTRTGEGEYEKQKTYGLSLLGYLKRNGYDLIEITTLEQMCFASNFLCVSDRSIVSVDTRRVADLVLPKLGAKAREDARYTDLLVEAQRDYENLRHSGFFFPHKPKMALHDVEFSTVRLEYLTGGYGGIHCMTCPLLRRGS